MVDDARLAGPSGTERVLGSLVTFLALTIGARGIAPEQAQIHSQAPCLQCVENHDTNQPEHVTLPFGLALDCVFLPMEDD